MRRAPHLVDVVRQGERVLEETEPELDLEDAADGVVDTRQADPSGSDLSKQQVLELLGAEGSMNMSVPEFTPTRTLYGVSPPIRDRPGRGSGGSPPSPR